MRARGPSRSPAASPPAGPARAPARVHVGLLAVQLSFGGFHVVAKSVLAHLDPVALIALRTCFAAPILAAYAWRIDRRLPRPADLAWLALLGFLGVFANQLLFIHGLERTTATNAAILMPSIPVFAVALGALLGIERVGRVRTFGILLAAAGAAVMVDPLRFSLAEGTLVGNGMILANCLAFAAFLVLQRPVLRRLPWRTVIAGAFVFGAAMVLAVGWPRLAALDAAAVPASAWWGLAYIVALPTVLAYALNTWAVRRSSPSLTAAYTTLQPVATAALAIPILGESVGWMEAAGFALIVGGLVVVAKRQELRAAGGLPG